MKLLLNIVRKDFWRLRWPLALWVATLAVRVGMGFSIILTGGFGGLSSVTLMLTNAGLIALGLLLTWWLTAMLVQEDSLVGATQFWMTRPISGARLLAGKLMGWLLLLWLPAVVLSLPWWIVCAFGPREIALAVLELLAWQAVAALPAALVAVVTDTLSRFLVWSFVLLFAFSTFPPAISAALAGWTNQASLGPIAFVALTTVALAAAGVIARQFLRRDVARSVAWFVVSAALAPVIGVFAAAGWSRLPKHDAQWTDWHAERAGSVSLVLRDYYVEGGKKILDEVRLYSVIEVRGLPDNLLLEAGDGAKQTWSWAGGPVVRRDERNFFWWPNAFAVGRGLRSALGGLVPAKPDEETERYEAQRRAERAARAPQPYQSRKLPPLSFEIFTEVFGPTYTRIKQAPPAYEASVNLRLLRPELWAEAPLQAARWRARAAHGFYVGALTKTDPDGPADAPLAANSTSYAPVRATMAEFIWDMRPSRSWSYFDWQGAGLYLVNRAGGDVWRQSVRSGPALTISSVGIQFSTMRVWQPTVRRGEKWVPRDPNWLAGATVAMVGFSEEARFTAEVKAERYEAAK